MMRPGRPGDLATALLFLLEYDRRRWQDGRFREAYNTGRLVKAASRSTMVEASRPESA
jgi:hypothetical protein